MNHIELGRMGENIACAFLQYGGYSILTRNYRSAAGEIDIIACKAEHLAFVEVKLRRTSRFGKPCEAVSPAKRRRIRRAALLYLQSQYKEDLKQVKAEALKPLKAENLKPLKTEDLKPLKAENLKQRKEPFQSCQIRFDVIEVTPDGYGRYRVNHLQGCF